MRTIATIFAAIAITGFGMGIANAGGAEIDNASGPRDVGASIEDGSGTPGPDWTKAADKPSRSDYDTAEEYNTAVSLWEAGERGRIANLAIQNSK